MDQIIIKNLEIFAYHGVLDFEKANGQKFYISVKLDVDLHAAGASDELDKTVNYAEVCELIREEMLREKYDLIESCAEHIAKAILIKYDMVRAANIVISKPDAPIDMTFETVCVDITRKKNIAYLGIGSNMGDKKAYIDFALDKIGEDAEINVKNVSSIIETMPYGGVKQDKFLNGCIKIETLYTPQELLKKLNDIERLAKRERLVHWGPRTLDLDILLYNQELIYEENLIIPHIDMINRDFVLVPLAEIAPYVIHPVYNQTIMELAKRFIDNHEGNNNEARD